MDPNRLAGAFVLALLTSTGCARRAGTSAEDTPMKDDAMTLPIACRPNALTKEERAHSAKLRAELAASTTETQELPNGYAFHQRADAALFTKTAEWIGLERRCCPFLSFDLRWQPGDATAPWLTLTGPEGTKGFLAAEMPELPRGQ